MKSAYDEELTLIQEFVQGRIEPIVTGALQVWSLCDKAQMLVRYGQPLAISDWQQDSTQIQVYRHSGYAAILAQLLVANAFVPVYTEALEKLIPYRPTSTLIR
ncbi:MAG: hypothetical protein ACFB0C_18495 [Leptolyngbyaceae cyanobacterium]